MKIATNKVNRGSDRLATILGVRAPRTRNHYVISTSFAQPRCVRIRLCMHAGMRAFVLLTPFSTIRLLDPYFFTFYLTNAIYLRKNVKVNDFSQIV